MALPVPRRTHAGRPGTGSRLIGASLVAACLAVLPVLRDDLGHGTGGLAAMATAIVLCDLLTAGLLVARFLARGSALPLLLGCTFLLAALLAGCRALVLPGLGGAEPAPDATFPAAEWLWGVGRAGLVLGVAASLWGGPPALRRALAASTLRRPAAALAACGGTVLVVGVPAALAVLAGDRLPAATDGDGLTTFGAVAAGAVVAIGVVVLAGVARRARRSELERRLPLVVGFVVAGSVLTLGAHERFTAGWYASWSLDLLAAAVVLVTLLRDPTPLGRPASADARAGARDPLTGVATRAAALVAADHLQRTRSAGAPLSLVLLDIDALRGIEDAHGALAADAVVLTVARRLRSLLRDEDVLARSGDEGFLVLLPGTDIEGATLVADRAVAAIRTEQVGTWAKDVRTTASGGVALVGEGEDGVARALAAADLALNQAKANGRDQVVTPARALVVPLRRAAAGSPPG